MNPIRRAARGARPCSTRSATIGAPRGDLQGAVSWTFTFHDQPWFNGLRALTTNEVALPVFNAFKLFARLGRTRVEATSTGMMPTPLLLAQGVRDQPDVGVAATRADDGGLRILLWNYHDVARDFAQVTPVVLRIIGGGRMLDVSQARILRIDETHANAYTRWRELGEPAAPTPEQVAALHDAARLRAVPLAASSPAAEGSLLRLDLPRQAVALIEIPPR